MKSSQKWFAAMVVTALPFSAAAEVLLTDAVLAPTSFWYTPIPANAALHPNSANLTKEILRQKAAYYQTVTINTRQYTSPVYIAAAGAPTVKVTQWDCQKKGYSDASLTEQWSAVPIPSHAVQSAGTDGEMTVYQPSTNTVWEFWQAKKVDGQWLACWGGRMQNASTNTSGSFYKYYGTTATSLPFIGGQITAEELRRGEIKHAIGFSVVEAEHFTTVSWPANRSDGWNPTMLPNRIAEGQRFRLDPTINVDALPMSTAGKIIAKAAQKYGFVVWDKSGALALRAQNAVSYTTLGQADPYPALFGGRANYAVLDGFPWERLQFLPLHYGKDAASTPTTTSTTTSSTTTSPTTTTTSPTTTTTSPTTTTSTTTTPTTTTRPVKTRRSK